MTSTADRLLLQLLEWIDLKERTYEEALEAWRTSCPRLPVWEEAVDQGLLARDFLDGRWLARITPAGMVLLRKGAKATHLIRIE